ncbi:MAG: SDR family NAD(P)-dependent oxidoreductase [Roseovarius sp.]
MFSFHQGVTVITGGGSGIGQATAIALAAQGVPVAVADIDQSRIDDTVSQITGAGGQALDLALDVTDEAAVDAAFTRAENWAGPITGLVNSAGILQVAPMAELSADTFLKVLDVNVRGSFLCGRRAAVAMGAQGYGRIVSLSSVSGYRAGIGRAAYGTSKSAIIGLTRQFALEFGRSGVTANAVAPGPTVTAMTEALYTEATRAAVLPMIPTGKLAGVDDITPAILFLLSEESRYINGITLPVDGGYLASGMLQTGELSG